MAATPTPALDRSLRRLSRAADHSKISLGVAAALALAVTGPAGRRRSGWAPSPWPPPRPTCWANDWCGGPRPDREAARVAGGRRVPMPASAAFPSGHTAAAVAFATAVGAVLPAAAVPLGTLAGAVAYARVRTGVHYPGDVAAGAVPDTVSAAAVPAAGARLPRVRRSGREVTTAAVPGGR